MIILYELTKSFDICKVHLYTLQEDAITSVSQIYFKLSKLSVVQLDTQFAITKSYYQGNFVKIAREALHIYMYWHVVALRLRF